MIKFLAFSITTMVITQGCVDLPTSVKLESVVYVPNAGLLMQADRLNGQPALLINYSASGVYGAGIYSQSVSACAGASGLNPLMFFEDTEFDLFSNPSISHDSTRFMRLFLLLSDTPFQYVSGDAGHLGTVARPFGRFGYDASSEDLLQRVRRSIAFLRSGTDALCVKLLPDYNIFNVNVEFRVSRVDINSALQGH